MTVRASIDIGSNSILLLIAEVENAKVVKELANESRVTSLGKNIDQTKMFAEESMQASFTALEEYTEIIKQNQIDPASVIVTATEASRVVQNSSEFFGKVLEELGLNVQLINAQGEAYYTAYGVGAGLSQDEVVIVDIGGASTEFTHLTFNPFKIEYSISLPVGSVRATDWIANGTFDEEISSLLEQLDYFKNKTIDYIGVAGTFTTLGAMIQQRPYQADSIQGFELTGRSLEELSSKISGQSPAKILETYPYIGKRANSIDGGLRAIVEFTKFLNINKFELSTFGLRYGVLMEGEISQEYKI